METKYIKYEGEVYKVLASRWLGDFSFYKLESQFSGGAPFGAKKAECKEAGAS